MPWLGEVPVIGTHFRSQSFQKKETDLVIIVTPHLVRPQIPGDKQTTPLDNRKPANDVEMFLGGKQEIQVTQAAQNGGGTHPRLHARATSGHELQGSEVMSVQMAGAWAPGYGAIRFLDDVPRWRGSPFRS